MAAIDRRIGGNGCSGGKGAVVWLRRGNGSGNRGGNRVGGWTIGRLYAVRLLSQSRYFLRTGVGARGSAGHRSGLRSVGDRGFARWVRHRLPNGWLASGRKARQVCSWSRTGFQAMYVDDQTPGIGKEKSRVV